MLWRVAQALQALISPSENWVGWPSLFWSTSRYLIAFQAAFASPYVLWPSSSLRVSRSMRIGWLGALFCSHRSAYLVMASTCGCLIASMSRFARLLNWAAVIPPGAVQFPPASFTGLTSGFILTILLYAGG